MVVCGEWGCFRRSCRHRSINTCNIPFQRTDSLNWQMGRSLTALDDRPQPHGDASG